ncbi:hypothetical protein LGH82_17495 [Mesorhizobium sp. PAMC28654]|uniref:hypothetical protein n=1 Tax=Mesorhizobium sp. PAMC28654 TaxID=2880934 RepID=UPI001D0B81AD|nr:hypothetical protein [Mesorhizobium sp. PAMC28654]UDL87013.1 hypothetical protein LGH82_17495 [Mesorhizobium sp. PAMC28654]
MIATLHPETAKSGPVYRAARLALLRQQMLRHFKRTDASAEKVEQALARLAEANPLVDRLAQHP